MKSSEGGATLVELVITIVVISVAIAGVVGAFALIASRSADPLNQTRAVELAQLYMDEIITKKYDENTPQGGQPKYTGACNIGADGGESRATYDDVDDYNGISGEAPRGALGALTGYSGFEVSVAVQCAGDDPGVGLPASEAKRIDITVTIPGDSDFVFSAYKANF